MKAKNYEINTVQDMIDCTNENNIDNFLKDLKALIKSNHALNDLVKNLSDIEDVNAFNAECPGFTWVDDGKHNIKIELSFKDPN